MSASVRSRFPGNVAIRPWCGVPNGPAITLVSITIGGGDKGKKEDIEDAALGTDDRSFRLGAEKVKGGRVYTVVYRATDRSGNATDVTRQVLVP